MMTVSLTAVICNFNKKDFLKGCLDSLLATQSDSLSINVIVVDNASTDGSQQMIENEYGKQVTLIAKAENTGGAGGFATGMRAAVETGCDYVALLDNDILLDTDTLPKLVAYLQTHSEVGVAGAKICTMDNPAILQELGAFIERENYGVKTPLKGHKDDTSLPDVVVCDYVPACCLVTRTEIIREAGVFDEAHFIYWDDMDWCTRVKLAGYEIHAIASARVQHKMGAVHATNTFSNYYFERNRLRYFAKYLTKESFDSFIAVRLSELPRQAFWASRKGQSSQSLSSNLSVYDFAMGQWYAQPQNILAKSEYCWRDAIGEDWIRLVVCDEPDNYTAVTGQILQVWPQARIISCAQYAGSEAGQDAIHVVSHILDVTEVPAGGYVVDRFFNVCQVQEVTAIQHAYHTYQQLFAQVHGPVIRRQLEDGYVAFHRAGTSVADTSI